MGPSHFLDKYILRNVSLKSKTIWRELLTKEKGIEVLALLYMKIRQARD